MRRKALAKEYDVCLKTVDNVLKLMRQSGLFTEDIIGDKGIVLVNHEAFGYALNHRDFLREEI